MENKKKFEFKENIFWSMIVFLIIALAGLWASIYVCSMNADEFNEYIKHYISNGTGAGARSSGLVSVFYSNFGRTGCLLFIFFCDAMVFCQSFEYLNTLRRYLRKEKLYKMGLVSDMDDDEKPKGLIESIKQLFSKSKPSSSFEAKYSRKELRKMKRELNEIEEKWKKGKRIR